MKLTQIAADLDFEEFKFQVPRIYYWLLQQFSD